MPAAARTKAARSLAAVQQNQSLSAREIAMHYAIPTADNPRPYIAGSDEPGRPI